MLPVWKGRQASVALVLLLFTCSCAHLAKRPGKEARGLFFSSLSSGSGYRGKVVFNGEISCRNRYYPVLLGASIFPERTDLIFYSPSGEVISHIRQDLTRGKFATRLMASSNSEMAKRITRQIENFPDDFSIGDMLSGRIPFAEREGDLFEMDGEYLYEGEGYRIRTGGMMSIYEADYSFDNVEYSIVYDYGKFGPKMPRSVKISMDGCVIDLAVENLFGEMR